MENSFGYMCLSIFLSVAVYYVYIFAGLKAYSKKALNDKSSTVINNLMFVLFLPAFYIIEIANLITINNIKTNLIILINSLVLIIIRSSVAFISIKLFKANANIVEVFAMIMMSPAFGTLTSVLSKALCTKGAPLAVDPACDNILGTTSMYSVLYVPIMFSFGLIYMNKGYIRFSGMKSKLEYLWFAFLSKKQRKDEFVDYLAKRYISNNATAEEIIYKFHNKYNIEVTSDFQHILKEVIEKSNDCLMIKDKQLENNYSLVKERSMDQIKRKSESEHDYFTQEFCITGAELIHFKSFHNSFIEKRKISLESDKAINEISNLSIEDSIKSLQAYYDKLFELILPFSDKTNELETEREAILHKLYLYKAPCFIVINSVELTDSEIGELNDMWLDYKEKYFTLHNENPIINKEIKIDITLMLQKILGPPGASCFLGILIGLSGMRDILFSKNHYITNLFEPLFLTDKTMVPLFMVLSSFQILNIPSFHSGFMISKKVFYLTFLLSYIIYPLLGYITLLIWKAITPNVYNSSIVLRFALFFPYLIPIGPKSMVMLNLLNKFFMQEFNYCLGRHDMLVIIFVTLMFIICFTLIE